MKYFKEYESSNHKFIIEVQSQPSDSVINDELYIVYQVETYLESREKIGASSVFGYQIEEEIQKHKEYAESYISRLYHKDKNHNEIILMNLGFKPKEQTPSCATCFYSKNGKTSCDRHLNPVKPDYSKGVECAHNNYAHYVKYEK